jgi:3-deoxy-D-manno-octulosonic-acid transferase
MQAQVLAAQRMLGQGRQPLLILAPRHAERGDEVARIAAAAGHRIARRSADELPGEPPGELPAAQADIWLADTLGEMGLWYRLASICFVGGSLVPAGGHTPFEPIQLGAAVLHGPHVANFAPAYAALDRGGGAVAVADAAALAAAIARLLERPEAAHGLRERACAVHGRLKPDVAAIAAELAGLMRAGHEGWA